MAANHSLFEVEAVSIGHVVVLRVSGELDRFTAHDLKRAFDQERGRDVIVLLRELTYLDMGGVRLLERERDAAQAVGRTLILAEPPPTVRKIIEVVRFDGPPVAETLRDALRHLRVEAADAERALSSGAHGHPGTVGRSETPEGGDPA